MRDVTAPTWAPPRPRLVILVFLLLLAANVFDAAATLRVIALGVEEWNPIMRYAVGVGPRFFVAVKMAMTAGLGGAIAVCALRWRWVWWALCLLTAGYIGLLIVHIVFLTILRIPLQ